MADKKEYDVVVVGAGMAGCIAAARIAQLGVRPGTGEKLRVALIEAGPYLERKRSSGFGHPQWRRMVPQIHWEEFGNVPTWSWSYGLKVVGGCSLHWGAYAFLPADVDYRNWVDEMGIDWTRENMREAVEDVERNFHIHDDPEEAYNHGNKLFREAGRALGFAPQPRQVARYNCLYCGFTGSGHGCKYDARATSLWYLPTFFENGGELIHDAEVLQVLIERQPGGGVVKGVEYRKDGAVQQALAGRVVVSCGAWGSPVLLAKSGYGPRRILGDKTIVENDNVGQNLDGDTNTGLEVIFDQPMRDGGLAGSAGTYWFEDDPEHRDGTGRIRMAEGMSEILYPHEAALSEFAPGWGRAHMDFMRTGIRRLGSIKFGVTKPPTRVKGWVDLHTGKHNYHGDPYIDKRLHVARDMAIELAKKMNCKISMKFPKTFAGRGGGHTNGTCRAGSNRTNSVINQDFESHEVKGLFVADASSYPRAISMNSGTMAAVVGAYAARRIVRNHFTRGS